ncbi:MAG: hypothetical protein MZW92_80000 [Comamonadaceae bacterium]|nr:hypothetical protein [Comamonadaceae bacterium]
MQMRHRCFGPAYEFAVIMDTDLRRRKIRDKVPMTFVTSRALHRPPGPGRRGRLQGHAGVGDARPPHQVDHATPRSPRSRPARCTSTEHDDEGKPKKEHELPFKYSMMLPAFKGVDAVFGIEGLTNPRGFILIDEHQRNPKYKNIYSVGRVRRHPAGGGDAGADRRAQDRLHDRVDGDRDRAQHPRRARRQRAGRQGDLERGLPRRLRRHRRRLRGAAADPAAQRQLVHRRQVGAPGQDRLREVLHAQDEEAAPPSRCTRSIVMNALGIVKLKASRRRLRPQGRRDASDRRSCGFAVHEYQRRLIWESRKNRGSLSAFADDAADRAGGVPARPVRRAGHAARGGAADQRHHGQRVHAVSRRLGARTWRTWWRTPGRAGAVADRQASSTSIRCRGPGMAVHHRAVSRWARTAPRRWCGCTTRSSPTATGCPPNLGVGEPIIKPKGIDDVPIVTLTLWTARSGARRPTSCSRSRTRWRSSSSASRARATSPPSAGPAAWCACMMDTDRMNGLRRHGAGHRATRCRSSNAVAAGRQPGVATTGRSWCRPAPTSRPRDDVKQLVVGVARGQAGLSWRTSPRVVDGPDQPGALRLVRHRAPACAGARRSTAGRVPGGDARRSPRSPARTRSTWPSA